MYNNSIFSETKNIEQGIFLMLCMSYTSLYYLTGNTNLVYKSLQLFTDNTMWLLEDPNEYLNKREVQYNQKTKQFKSRTRLKGDTTWK